MIKYIIFFLVIPLTFTSAQELERIGAEDLDRILQSEDNQLHVINFWATWCGPCVTELPYFQEASRIYKDKNVSFLLISLDFPSQVDSRLKPFLEEKDINLPVVLMEDLDYNKWVSKVDSGWKGNLPATLVFNNAKDKRSFVSGAIEKHELVELIEENVN